MRRGGLMKKSVSLPAYESPLKLRVPPCFSIGYMEPLPTAHTALSAAFYLLCTCSYWQWHYKLFGNCSQWRSKLLKTRMLLFSVGNGLWTPRDIGNRGDELLCDISNGTLNYRNIINDAMNFSVILKTGESTYKENGETQFSLWKSQHSTHIWLFWSATVSI